MESQREQGFFYLPKDPKDKIAGILTYNIKDGTKLELIGAFENADEQPQIILGYNQERKLFTLYNNFRLRHSYSCFTNNSFYLDKTKVILPH